MFLAFKHVIEMRAKRLGVNCIIVKTIVHLNTLYLNINRFSTFYQEILVLMGNILLLHFLPAVSNMNQITCCFISETQECTVDVPSH